MKSTIKYFFIGFLSVLILVSSIRINKSNNLSGENNLILNIKTIPVNYYFSKLPENNNYSLLGKHLNKKSLMINASNSLVIPTYVKDNNQAIHPSIFYDPDMKYGYRYILAFTPYSFLNDQTENPSIVVSNDGINFKILEDVPSPLVKPEKNCHLSDVCIFEKDSTLEIWYRESNKKTRLSRLLRITTNDLISYTKPQVILDYGTSGYGLGSPSVLYEDGVYKIYYRKNMDIGSDSYVYRASLDLKSFTNPIPLKFDKGEWTNYHPWHLEIKKVNNIYYCLTMNCPDGKMDTSSLFLLESYDGINFKNPIKILEPSEKGHDNWLIYKSTFMVKDDTVWLYYSAIDKLKKSTISLLSGPDFLHLKPVY
ncbi:MAG: hypothetical protein Q4E02_03555 [Lagierella massiliensis]|nr:hypothetical protein [Lagierella massiliensis]